MRTFNKALRVQILFALAALGAVGTASASDTDLDAERVPMEFSTAYVPIGYDDNDWVEFMADGVFTDPCDRAGPAKARYDEQAKRIFITASGSRLRENCGTEPQRFQQLFKLDPVPVGDIPIEQDGRVIGRLLVIHTERHSIDSSSFTPVDRAWIATEPDGTQLIHLAGTTKNSCFQYAHSMVEVQPNVILVLPISRLWEFGCREGNFPFEVTVPLPPEAGVGRRLLHVRAAGGRSVNTLVDLP